MRRAIVFCVLLGLVCLSCSILLGQQPAKSSAPPPKKTPAAQSPTKVTPPAPGTTRLYLAVNGYDDVLILRPPANSRGNCLRRQMWKRKLEGDLKGTQYAISLKASTDEVAYRRTVTAASKKQVHSAKIRASILVRRHTDSSLPPGDRRMFSGDGLSERRVEGPLPPYHVEKLREWAKANVREDAPPQPDPADYQRWRDWVFRNIKRPDSGKADPSKPSGSPQSFSFVMPSLEELDDEARKQGLQARGEVLLASAVFETQAREKLLTAKFQGPDSELLPGDELIFWVDQLEGYSCVFSDSEGFVYIDIPETPLAENKLDAANRAYVITGTLVTKDGAPVANKEVLFLPVDASGNGLTTFGPPTAGGTMFMTNPRTKTNAQGRFTLRVAASFFQQSADPTSGRVQPVESMGSGRLRHVGKGVAVKLTDSNATRIDLGRVTVAFQ